MKYASSFHLLFFLFAILHSKTAHPTVGIYPSEPVEAKIVIEEVVSFSDNPYTVANLTNYKKIIPLSTPAPAYPAASVRLKESGVIRFMVIIGADGAVRDVKIIDSPFPRLTMAISAVARKWTFKPMKLAPGEKQVVGHFQATFLLQRPEPK